MNTRMLSFVVSFCLAATVGTSVASDTDVASDPLRLEFEQAVNLNSVGRQLTAIRNQHGLPQRLSHSPQLQAAAQYHADDMARTGNFSHTGSGGSNLRSRVRSAGYNGCFWAENLAFGQPNIETVMSQWMGSPGHRRNMLAPQARQYGFARAGTFYVLVLGRPC